MNDSQPDRSARGRPEPPGKSAMLSFLLGMAAAAYIVEQLVYNFVMAITTYFQKTADPQDIAPSLALGFTINHTAAVFIPAAGGMLWLWNFRLVFWGGVVLSLIALILTRYIPRH
ncbi:MAG: hypothetical protein AB1641_22715 [Thermodesulfobacteriota bacterium]